MKEIKIESNKKTLFKLIIENIYKRLNTIIILLNLSLAIYLIIQNNKNKIIKKEFYNINYKEKDLVVDKDMIGLKYPEIKYKEIKSNYIDGKIFSSFLDLMKQLETKLIYLEKEINVTKLISFFTNRKLYLKENNVTYNESDIKEYHDMINWLIIHESTQLKGIASDKYLACKYVKIKLGENLCPHRIKVYDRVEDIDFEKIIKMGNVILKVTNGNDDNIFINDKMTSKDIDKIKNDITFHYNRNYPLHVPSLFHLFSKKRIVLEKMFIPITDLYEFKFLLVNRDLKLIIIRWNENEKMKAKIIDKNYNYINNESKMNWIKSRFKEDILNKMKNYAYKLSEDFKNFIRVDLYVFQDKIYLSELTFDSHAGLPVFLNIPFFHKEMKSWKRVDVDLL